MTVYPVYEHRLPGRPLGRHVRHDPRSLRYLLPEAPAQTVEWERFIPILDQDTPPAIPGLLPTPKPLGSCTGNAVTGALGSAPFYDTLKDLGDQLLTFDEVMAVRIYDEAERLDGGRGLPREDNGSTGLSVAKVAKNHGWDNGYQHAVSVDQAHGGLAIGPILFGIPWLSSFDEPSSEGIVKITEDAYVRGGHEIVDRQYDASRDLWWLDNSWTTGWGKNGRFAFDTPTLQKLLDAQGDVTSLVPITAPVPNPTPAPVLVDAADQALAALIGSLSYLDSNRTGDNRKVRDGLRLWETAKGLIAR